MDAKLLRAHRQLAGLTQTDLAARCGRKQAWVSSFERGASVPSADGFRKLARALGVPVEVLKR